MNGADLTIPPWAAGVAVGPAWRGRVLAADEEAGARVVELRQTPSRRCHERVVIAKHYTDGKGATARDAMAALWSQLCAFAPLAVPRVLGWDPVAGVLVQERADGIPLLPALEDESRRSEALERCVAALTCLHSLPVDVGRAVGMTDHMRELIRPVPELVAERVPAAGERIRDLVAGLTAAERAAGRPCDAPIHRDFHARQMLLDHRRVWVVDWDLFARGDPALDLANFIVYLRTHVTRRPQAAVEEVVERYTRTAGSDVIERLPMFVALTYLRLACKSYRLQRLGWRVRVDEMLAAAERALGGRAI